MKVIRTGVTSTSTPAVQPLIEIIQFLKFFIGGEYKNADIAHIHTSIYWSFLRMLPYVFLIRHFSKAKLIIHNHSGEFKQWFENSPGLIKLLIRSTFRSADCLIVTSPNWIGVMNEVDSRLATVTSLPNGFDSEIFHPINKFEARESVRLPADRKVLLTVGYLEKVKGHRYLIEAMSAVLKRRNDTILIIIGKGTLKEQLTSLVKDLHLDDNVFFVESRKSPQEIALWMNSADIFVLSSLNEGNPTVMFESLGCGKPFIGTRVGGIPDVIKSEKIGLLCEPADSAGLADCILAALDITWDEDYISSYAQQFTWKNITSELMEVYKRTLNQDDE